MSDFNKYKEEHTVNILADGTIEDSIVDNIGTGGGGSSLVPTPFIKKDTYQNLNLTTGGSAKMHTFQKDSFFVLNIPEMAVNGNNPNRLLFLDENSKTIVDIGKLRMLMGMAGNSYRQYSAFAKAGQKLWNNTSTVDINFDMWELDSMEVSGGSGGADGVTEAQVTDIANQRIGVQKSICNGIFASQEYVNVWQNMSVSVPTKRLVLNQPYSIPQKGFIKITMSAMMDSMEGQLDVLTRGYSVPIWYWKGNGGTSGKEVRAIWTFGVARGDTFNLVKDGAFIVDFYAS